MKIMNLVNPAPPPISSEIELLHEGRSAVAKRCKCFPQWLRLVATALSDDTISLVLDKPRSFS